ncbi:unnamed protein product [Orchesella dallaii]|uniref:Uncharacterized protein n=1 Tax=Orchesella dallaii TaxID=48710 RepID=A0ABP1PX38_9HEXA
MCLVHAPKPNDQVASTTDTNRSASHRGNLSRDNIPFLPKVSIAPRVISNETTMKTIISTHLIPTMPTVALSQNAARPTLPSTKGSKTSLAGTQEKSETERNLAVLDNTGIAHNIGPLVGVLLIASNKTNVRTTDGGRNMPAQDIANKLPKHDIFNSDHAINRTIVTSNNVSYSVSTEDPIKMKSHITNETIPFVKNVTKLQSLTNGSFLLNASNAKSDNTTIQNVVSPNNISMQNSKVALNGSIIKYFLSTTKRPTFENKNFGVEEKMLNSTTELKNNTKLTESKCDKEWNWTTKDIFSQIIPSFVCRNV